jgi:hypothetical protein
MKRIQGESVTTFGQTTGGTAVGRTDWPKCVAIALALLLAEAAGATDQWTNPLIGEWQGMMHSADQYNLPFDITYSPDGTFVSTVALPGQRGTNTGSGMMYSRGHWSMTGPHSIQLIFTESKSCAAGGGCFATPGGLGRTEFSFQMQGTNELIGSDGSTSYRVR